MTLPLIVETPLMLNAKVSLSGVNKTSNVLAPIPLLSIHVASDFEPIALIARAGCIRVMAMIENIRNMDDNDGDKTLLLCVRVSRGKRIVSNYCRSGGCRDVGVDYKRRGFLLLCLSGTKGSRECVSERIRFWMSIILIL